MSPKNKPTKYETMVKPRLEEIAVLAETKSILEIADELGIGKTMLIKYINLHPELKEAFERGRAKKQTNYEKFVQPRLDEIRELAKEGAPEIVIANYCGVSRSAWKEYKIKHKTELVPALEVGAAEAIYSVRQSLFKMATGYKMEEMTPEGVTIERYYKPEVAAAIAYLKSNDPEFHADDNETRELKKRLADISEQKMKNAEWQ